jgi:hypothetical protein
VLTACESPDQPVRPASVLVELVLDRRRLGPVAYVRCCLAHAPVAGCSAGRMAVDVPGLARRHSDRRRPQPQAREQSAAVPDLRAWTVPAWTVPVWAVPARTGPARTGPAWAVPVCPPAARPCPWQQSHRCLWQAALAQLMLKQQGLAMRVELLNGLRARQLLTQLRPGLPSSQVPDVRKAIA